MLRFLVCTIFSGIAVSLSAQQTISDSILHDGMYRSYILYVPASYTPGTAAPLVFNFHGYTSNAGEQMLYGDFRPIADTAGFLVVHPQGTLDGSNQPYWNSDWGGTVDDIGFTEALMDSLSVDYTINQSRIYSTGMSNGGFMSYTLACSLSQRIAAIASVTGSMNIFQSASCNPQHPMPVMEIHGTADGVVPYTGTTTTSSIPDVLDYWVNTNVCDAPVQTEVPNTNPADGCTATHFLYANGNNGVEIEHYRINNGGHTWPGAPVVIGTTNYDIDASVKIWEFFSKYDLYGKITGISSPEQHAITCYPNPAQNALYLSGDGLQKVEKIRITDARGNVVLETTGTSVISLQNIPAGLYIVQFLGADFASATRLSVQ